MIRFLENLQFVLFVFFSAAYAYQFFYLAVELLESRRNDRKALKQHRYAAVISARNEENVIAGLIGSLKKQEYPSKLLDIFVIADNCTDHTAQVAKKAGAIVYERENKTLVGKGYALDYLFHRIFEDYGEDKYEGFFVFDADNIVDSRFVLEMNRMFDTGKYAALTSYRNSKNYCDNWISAGYALWFLRESKFLNGPRTKLGLNCAVSGTGFLVAADVIREDGGWPYHLLTEDIQFSVCCATKGRKIGYCGKAMIFDEQPTEFKQSWDQRLRWSKGFYQVDVKYTKPLIRGCAKGGRFGMSCYDMLMTVAPCNLATIGMMALAFLAFIASLGYPAFVMYRVLRMLARMLALTVFGVSWSLLLFGAVTLATEWDNIKGKSWKKIFYLFTFPLFMLTYIPISLAALVGKVEWKPIRHGMTAEERERA